jgi:hypothetical protein
MFSRNTFIVALALAVAPVATASAANNKNDMASQEKKVALHDGMRKLWEEHVTWTRLFIVSDAGSLPDKDAVTERLLKNQQDIGDAIKPYFGDAAGTQLTGLLKDHILIAAQLVDAAKAKDSAKVDEASAKWTANADQLAQFLSTADPKDWKLDATKAMLHEHLSLTTDEAKAQLEGRYADSVADYDKIEAQALMMADTLTNGIEAKFPTKFQERQAKR